MENDDTAVAVIFSGLPEAVRQSQPALSRFVLRKAGERAPQDLSKIYIPFDQQGTSLGVAIVRYVTDNLAQRAINNLNGMPIDVNHSWRAERVAASQEFADIDAQGRIDARRINALRNIEEDLGPLD